MDRLASGRPCCVARLEHRLDPLSEETAVRILWVPMEMSYPWVESSERPVSARREVQLVACPPS